MAYNLKQNIQQFWTENVPGLDIAYKKYSPQQKEFYITADTHRYKYEKYVLPLIDSFAQGNNLILEIGCGLGSDSRYIAKKGSSVISLDLSPSNVGLTIKGMQLFGLKGRGVCADAENIPFKENSFDVVYSFGVLHHTPDTQKAINEIYRVLKPKGRCVIMLYHKGYAYYLLLLMHPFLFLKSEMQRKPDKLMSEYDHTPLSKLYSKREIRQLFEKFQDVDIEITTYGGIQNHRFLKYIYKALNKSRFLMSRLGSYLLIRANK